MTILHLDTPNIAPYGDLSLRTKQEYAARHGLGITAIRDTLDASRPPSWSKIPLCLQALEKSDWLWWLDADAAITNPEIDVRQYCDEAADMIATKDENGLNCGSFLLRNSEGARRLLDATWNRTALIHHQWWEQGAMHVVLQQQPDIAIVKFIDQRAINSYVENWQPGDLVIHLAGKPNRLELMKQYAK